MWFPYRMLFTVAAIAVCTLVQAQVTSPQIKTLSWSDYKGAPDYTVPFYSFTVTETNFDAEIVGEHNGILQIKFRTWNFLTNKSWVKMEKANAQLLSHEQGHYDISCLFALDLKKQFSQARYTTSNYKLLIDQIYRTVSTKYLRLDNQYEKETNHSLNKTEQLKWNNWIRQEMVRLLRK